MLSLDSGTRDAKYASQTASSAAAFRRRAGVPIAAFCLAATSAAATAARPGDASSAGAHAASALSHWRAGSVCMYSAVPLVLATAVGGYYGSKLAVDLPEEQTKTLFAATIFGLGVRRLML